MAGGVSMWPKIALADVLDALALEETGPDAFRARNIRTHIPRTLGAQVLAQTVVAAERVVPHMTVHTLHGVFPRAGDPERPTEVTVERVHEGRSVAVLQVTFRQGDDREHYRAFVTCGVDGPELVRHGDVLAEGAVPPPEECAEIPVSMLPWEARTPGGADALAPGLAGPPTLDLWMRCTGVPDTPVMARALVAHATEGFLGPVALRPYPAQEIERRGGRGMSVALSQSITYHEEFSVHDWLLLRCASAHAAAGRMHGRIAVHTRDGRRVASVSADGLMRPGR